VIIGTNVISGQSGNSYDPVTDTYPIFDTSQTLVTTSGGSCISNVDFDKFFLYGEECGFDYEILDPDYEYEDCVETVDYGSDPASGFTGEYTRSFSYPSEEDSISEAVAGYSYKTFSSFDYGIDYAVNRVLTLSDEGDPSCPATQVDYLEFRYNFKIRFIGSRCNRVTWVERFIPEAGVGLDSIEVISPGVYRPTVTISPAIPSKPTASAVAVMTPSGTVSSINILARGDYRTTASISGGGGFGGSLEVLSLNPSTGGIDQVLITPGQNYTSAPTITFATVTAPMVRATATLTIDTDIDSPTYKQINGITWTNRGNYRPGITFSNANSVETTATATAIIDSSGKVTGATITNAGQYLPTITIAGPYGGGEGQQATASVTMDKMGGIDSVQLTSPGSAYASEPAFYVNAKTYPITEAVLHVHMGTETAKCHTWDGKTLAGRWVKRVLDDAGHPLSSIEVVSGGSGYTTSPRITIPPPQSIAVTISAPSAGGVQATASAFVNNLGRVNFVSIQNEGSGYTSPPTVSILAPGLGGTQATGWVANLTNGKVTSITGGTPGDYAVAATANMVSGSISSITITKAGAGFKTAPAISIDPSPKGNVFVAAHFGTETEYDDGNQPIDSVPLGYVDEWLETYPLLVSTGNLGTAPWKYFEVSVPTDRGITTISNVRSICDCSSC
jgi:hypothetical protein